MLIFKLLNKKIQDEQIKEIQKPEKPDCLPSKRGYWNGKVYGNEKYGYRVYIDNCEEKLLKQEAEEIKAYLTTMEKSMAQSILGHLYYHLENGFSESQIKKVLEKILENLNK